MVLPILNPIQTSQDAISEFRGYNHNLSIQENEFYDMQNMTSTFYPVLSPRSKRGIIRTMIKPNGFVAKDELAWVDGTTFYYNGMNVGQLEDSQKQFVSMGAYLLIFPDKKYYNVKTGELKDMGALFETVSTVTFTLCSLDGTDYSAYIAQNSEPTDPDDKQLWLDTSMNPPSLKQFSVYSGSWASVATTYIKIASTGIGAAFAEYDGVFLSGITAVPALNNTSTIIWKKAADYIVVIGILSQTVTQSTAVTVERKVPDMDFMTESQNRVWGCSSLNHEVYACKLGDPTNWNCFMGIASDSYALTIGSDGEFTGAFTHLGSVLFFKEDVVHKLYGSKPANYELKNINIRGVEKGSEKSLCLVNETLYYKTRTGIVAYDGNLPVTISEPLGMERYSAAVGGAIGSKYYISMKDSTNTWHLFSFDESKGLWHREDNTHVYAFAKHGAELFYVDASDYTIQSVNGTTSLYNAVGEVAHLETSLPWSCESTTIGARSPDDKYVSKIQIRMSIATGSTMNIYLQYDSSGAWEEAASLTASALNHFTVPIITPRCDHFKIKFTGTGDAKIFMLSKVMERGSEI